jgi:hypothetical protein
LAAFLGDEGAAKGYFEDALAFNVRTRQRTWAARTRYHFASFLLTSGGTDSLDRASELLRIARGDAQEIGMAGLARDIERLTQA